MSQTHNPSKINNERKKCKCKCCSFWERKLGENVNYIAVKCRGLSPCHFLSTLHFAMPQQTQITVIAKI
jgi:hypothetical protein